MKQVPVKKSPFCVLVLTKGYVAIVDRNMWPRVRALSWYAHISKGKGRNHGHPYARTNINGKKVYLHRFLTNCPPGFDSDHKNHQTLDCRIVNLEVVTKLENQRRKRSYRGSAK